MNIGREICLNMSNIGGLDNGRVVLYYIAIIIPRPANIRPRVIYSPSAFLALSAANSAALPLYHVDDGSG
jgi:hypothetical protein